MDSGASLQQIESVCEGLYNPTDLEARKRAEQLLNTYATNVEYYPQAKAVIESSKSPYAQHLACTALVKLMTAQSANSDRRVEVRNFVLNQLASRAGELQDFVVTELVLLLTRVTKVGWWESDTHREIVKDTTSFLNQPSSAHYFVGLTILNQLVAEMNAPTPGISLIQQRKTSMSFRDALLMNIFEISLTALRQLHENQSVERKLKEQAINLVLRCLSFDFIGTSQDDSTEDLGTIQLPSSWRQYIEDTSTMQLLFDVYRSTSPPLSNAALECLVKVASVRRSLIQTEQDRSNFLGRLVRCTNEILRTKQGLQEHSNYHEFCRLLGRLKTNYQLSELVAVEGYQEWIKLVADFTITSLNSWQWTSTSVYYLLCLWSRLVSSLPYLKGESPSLLETYVPNITETFISSRLESVNAVLQGNFEPEDDPLENEDQLQDQLDNLPHLCRFRYEDTMKRLISLIDPLLQVFVDYSNAQGVPTQPDQLALAEGQMTWLTYIVGSILRGRLSSSTDHHEVADGELACRIFRLAQVMDQGAHVARYNERLRQRLDLALLNFFQHFRKVYVGEQIMHSAKVYSQLSENLGLSDHVMVLNAMVVKITTNLKQYNDKEEVVERSLSLLQELAAGYMSGKLLLKIDVIHMMLVNHTQEHFPFLNNTGNTRNRTTFYYTLGRLLFMEDSNVKFNQFVEPFTQLLTQLLQQAEANAGSFRSQQSKLALIGLFRDLRGLTQATSTRRTYGMIFDWLYPRRFPLVQKTCEIWADDPDVTTPLLKFVAEFVHNKTQRLTFDSSSVNGILLFREVSKLLNTYGNFVLSMGTPADVYKGKYKGMSICLRILTRALAGNYVNFGVFELYGDPALSDALDIALKMSLSIPLNDILSYRKVGKAYYSLLEVLSQWHTRTVIMCNTQTFSHIIHSLEAGLRSLDVTISSQCSSAIDNITTFYFNRLPIDENSDEPSKAIATHFANLQSELHEILYTLFEIVLFEECANQWSLSRPMLSLILVNESYFGELKQRLIATQPQERQERVSSCFDKLMQDISRSLDTRNRDRFTQNLTVFRCDALNNARAQKQ